MKVKRGDIIYLKAEAYGCLVGRDHIQSGIRPLLIVSNDKGNKSSEICIAVPLTRKLKRHLPTHVYLNSRNSIVMCEQIFTFSQHEIDRITGNINEDEFKKVNRSLKISLGIERG